MPNKEFLCGVAEVVISDPSNSNAVMLHGEALLDSTLTASMDSTVVNAGRFNEKIFQYPHTKTFDVKLTSAQFDYKYLAMQNGAATFSTGTNSVLKVECKTFDASNQATISSTPASGEKVYYIDDSGNAFEVSSISGTTVTVSNSSGKSYTLIYKYNTTTDKIIVGSATAPKIITVDLIVDLFNQNGLAGQLQVHIPRVQLSGAFELSLTPSGVSSTPLEGTALAVSDEACGGRVYAYMNRIYNASLQPTITGLAIAPSPVNLDISESDTQLLAVYAMYSNGNTRLLDNAQITFTSSDATKATVAVTGIVTPVAAGSAYIKAEFTDGSLSGEGEVRVVVVA